MTTDWLLNEVATISESNLDWIKKRYSNYSENQLNWKPNNDTWSLNEIFAHLNDYSKFYNQQFELKIAATRFLTPNETFTSSPLGKSAWNSIKLGNAKNIKRKFNSPKIHNPNINKSIVKGNDWKQFETYQKELLLILEKAVGVNLKKVRVPLSISKLVRLRLGDTLLFVSYHNERHLQQALNLSKLSAFPKK